MDPQLVRQIHTVLKCLVTFCFFPYYLIEAILKLMFASPKNVEGNIVLVTGAANGLGRSISVQLARLGCKVLAVDIKKEDLDETVAIIQREQGNKDSAKGYICDISNREAVNKLRDDVLKEHGRLDMLFNNAGIIYFSTFSESTDENIMRVVDINILGQIWMTRAFLPSMKNRKKGHIVYTSSFSAIVNTKEFPYYAMTKAALTGLALSLKDDLTSDSRYKDIQITIVHPALINSNNFIKVAVESPWPGIHVDEAARMLIEGARKNFIEFALPGFVPGHVMLKLTRLFPWAFMKQFLEAFQVKMKHDPDEAFWSNYMTNISQKDLYKMKELDVVKD